MPRFQVVVSVENSAYLVWQAMLFHYSCLHHLRHAPIIVVHTNGERLQPGFDLIKATGGVVQFAPNYRSHRGVNYPPRNSAGTLRHVQADAEYLVLCDPDMIFLQPVRFGELNISNRQISVDHVCYLDPDLEHSRYTLNHVVPLAGVTMERIRSLPYSGGVPHVISQDLKRQLSDEWLQCIEWFPTVAAWPTDVAGAPSRECYLGRQKEWLATMWALVFAIHRLGLEPILTRWAISNCFGKRPLPPINPAGPMMIHYCYPDPGFDKRDFTDPSTAEETVWNVLPDDGSISGAVRAQLREARAFYGIGTQDILPR